MPTEWLNWLSQCSLLTEVVSKLLKSLGRWDSTPHHDMLECRGTVTGYFRALPTKVANRHKDNYNPARELTTSILADTFNYLYGASDPDITQGTIDL